MDQIPHFNLNLKVGESCSALSLGFWDHFQLSNNYWHNNHLFVFIFIMEMMTKEKIYQNGDS